MEHLDATNLATTVAAVKRPRTSEDFYLFCKIILEYENYENKQQQEELSHMKKTALVDTVNNAKPDLHTNINRQTTSNEAMDSDIDTDSDNFISCYCGKPFAKRPMIECSKCLTWLHLSCVKIKRNNIPKVFYCYKCKETLGIHTEQTSQYGVSSNMSTTTTRANTITTNHTHTRTPKRTTL